MSNTFATDTGAPRDSEHGRGHGPGRGGRGRGRRRGRDRAGLPAQDEATWPTVANVGSSSHSGQPRRERPERAPKPHLTHFIAIPLGHNPTFRKTVSEFTAALLSATPAIPGLDATVVIPARRMHFTLGVMSLGLELEDDPRSTNAGRPTPQRTLEAATKVLHELKPKVKDLLQGEKLRVSLDSMDIMHPERGNQERTHVMWVGPGDGASTEKFRNVAHLIQKTFQKAGLLVDEERPLKLHCTVLNTLYRKPRSKNRVPFSYTSILGSQALKSVLMRKELIGPSELQGAGRGLVQVNFGEWEVDEVQICEMGSWGPEGEYIAVARCSLDPD